MLFYLLSGCCFLVALIIFVTRRGSRNVTVEGDSNGMIITGDNASNVKQVNAAPMPAKPASPSSWQWIERGLLAIGVVITALAYFCPRSG
ncbi:MAG: hypothetical protein DRQ54_09320 [Gammaproteobacteria bacterium]|nr:MAG: hypothetical protein DRQ54_09320 [Gammaproteobacteria bacterium]RLA10369.1 MAG: hypothetical protein DRQ52_11490 [Gammaproteobacteria bacterium]